ncbi:MAG: TonB-dependent receptor plug domain-containing protein [Bacteroidota bacterium]
MHRFIYCMILLSGGLLMACGSSKSSLKNQVQEEEQVDLGYTQTDKKDYEGASLSQKGKIREQTLANYLRKIPNLLVTGSGSNTQVSINGFKNSALMSNQPLFVLDGVRIGHSLAEASNLVTMSDVAKVTVLRTPSEIAMYGIEGTNGVIVIRSKK